MTAVGDHAPPFALPDTEGTIHEPDKAPVTVVVFTCNHCPYALAWHERIVEVARDYADRGVRVLAVNPNDAENYPRDSLQAMRARVERGEFEGVPYLCDESQDVARCVHARCRRGAPLPRRPGRRPRRPRTERRLPARRPRCGARRARPQSG